MKLSISQSAGRRLQTRNFISSFAQPHVLPIRPRDRCILFSASSPPPDSPVPEEPTGERDQPKASSTSQTNVSSNSSNLKAPQDLQTWFIQAWQTLVNLASALVAWLSSFPAYVESRRREQLREDAQKDEIKEAEWLSYLNQRKEHQEVVEWVEKSMNSKPHLQAAVVVEYLGALHATGKLSEYATDLPLNPSSSADHRSLSTLLGELKGRVNHEQPDSTPGISPRRPLHIAVSGGAGAFPNSSSPAPTGPSLIMWQLLRSCLVISCIALAWLIGSQVVRRVQMQQGAVYPSTAQIAPSTFSSSIPPPSQSSGGPSTEPKEYKKEELPEKSVKTFADVRGCDEAKGEMEEVVEFLKNPSKFTRLGAKLPKGVLLTGPPGTGKTLLAKAVAGEAGVPFFYRAGSEFEELYVGVGARRMRALFAAAKKKAPCIVFIDEIDAIGGNRKHWDNNTRKTLNQLLTEMDGFESSEGVIVVAATNLAETLDPALKRPGRFDRQVAVPLPDIKGRSEILAHYLQDKPIDPSVDRELLAKQSQGFSGADISNLINEAALLCAKEDKDVITPRMLDYAFDKIKMGVERKSARRTEEGQKRTAYHEAGHAVVAIRTKGASPVHKATIVPRGHALGMVTQVGRDDEFSISRIQMLARIRVCMGGTVAEQLTFGSDNVSSGATDDLRQATEMARYMVVNCGMNEVIGPQYISEEGSKLMSEELRQKVDGEVSKMLLEAKEEVKKLLTDREAELEAVARALMEKETLTGAEIEELLGISPPAPDDSGGSEARKESKDAEGGVVEVQPLLQEEGR